MSNLAIKVENLGKKYVINHETSNSDDNFREVLIGNTKKMLSSLNPFRKSKVDRPGHTREDFWALNDVNFTINKGDKVGIIGRNGAGKSTLLKVLSRITEPTTGKIYINGRIASLLEVGTGFHPELTGRENIYLNGAILGMSRKEITEKFEEIVAFAEVEIFLDTPVKRYSSGMYVRLAFAVAAHLEPEILIVDEVLAVGDVEFQKKCLGKMGKVSREGRTVIFVSHNMKAIESLCNKAIFMKNGSINYQGEVQKAIQKYHFGQNKYDFSIDNCARRDGVGGAKLINFSIYDINHKSISIIDTDKKYTIELEINVSDEYIGKELDIGLTIDNEMGERLITMLSSWRNKFLVSNEKKILVICEIDSFPLVKGNYLVSYSIAHKGITLDYIEHFHMIEIQNNYNETTRTSEHGDVMVNYYFKAK